MEGRRDRWEGGMSLTQFSREPWLLWRLRVRGRMANLPILILRSLVQEDLSPVRPSRYLQAECKRRCSTTTKCYALVCSHDNTTVFVLAISIGNIRCTQHYVMWKVERLKAGRAHRAECWCVLLPQPIIPLPSHISDPYIRPGKDQDSLIMPWSHIALGFCSSLHLRRPLIFLVYIIQKRNKASCQREWAF